MTWLEIAYTLTDKFDYIAFAIACRDAGVEQQFRPQDYLAILKDIDAIVQTGLTPQEARLQLIEQHRPPTAPVNGAPCGGCGGGKVL